MASIKIHVSLIDYLVVEIQCWLNCGGILEEAYGMKTKKFDNVNGKYQWVHKLISHSRKMSMKEIDKVLSTIGR